MSSVEYSDDATRDPPSAAAHTSEHDYTADGDHSDGNRSDSPLTPSTQSDNVSNSNSRDARYSPHMRRQLEMMAECCQQAEVQYNHLSKDLHIPALDDTLFRKYLLPSTGPQVEDDPEAVQIRLTKLLRLLDVFSHHKEATLSVLENIAKREQTFQELITLQSNETLQALEIQSVALQALYQLQTQTLAVVESIVHWRKRLSLPFAFMKGDENYLLRIAESMHQLERSEIGKILPLQFSRFPLCSNVPSMKLFKEDPEHLTYPLRSQRQTVNAGTGAADSPVYRKRLVAAESVIHEEVELQMYVLSYLMKRCRDGFFLPVLDLAACRVYPGMKGLAGYKAAGRKDDDAGPRRGSVQRHSSLSGSSAKKPPQPSQGGTAAAAAGGCMSLTAVMNLTPRDLPGIQILSGRHQMELLDAIHSSAARLHDGPLSLTEEQAAEAEEDEEEGDAEGTEHGADNNGSDDGSFSDEDDSSMA